jgi:hypothetical protein
VIMAIRGGGKGSFDKYEPATYGSIEYEDFSCPKSCSRNQFSRQLHRFMHS